jgi:hypothetical protein
MMSVMLAMTAAIGAFAWSAVDPDAYAVMTRLGAVAAALLLAAVLLVVAGVAARLVLTTDGWLDIRSVPPWRHRRLRVADLVSVSARITSLFRPGTAPVASFDRAAMLSLTDRSGARVKFCLDVWRDERELLEALVQWAAMSGATIDETTKGLLKTSSRPVP